MLQFVMGTGIPSELIAWWGSGYSGYSHVDARLADGSLLGARSDTAGGQPPGFRSRPAEYEQWQRRCVVTIPATPAEYVQWEQWLLSQVGVGYDKGDILGLILGRPMAQEGHWICSAAQTNALRVVNKLPTPLPFDEHQITPNTLLSMTACLPGATFAAT